MAEFIERIDILQALIPSPSPVGEGPQSGDEGFQTFKTFTKVAVMSTKIKAFVIPTQPLQSKGKRDPCLVLSPKYNFPIVSMTRHVLRRRFALRRNDDNRRVHFQTKT